MHTIFKLKPLLAAVAALSVTSVAYSAGLERSGQDTTAFFQDGTYAETVYTYIDADITGKDINGQEVKDIAEDYDFFRYGVKTDIDDTFSIGVLYDEPWGAAANYEGVNDFVGVPDDVVNGIIAGRFSDRGITNIEGLRDLVAGTEQQLASVESQLDAGRAQIAQAEGAIAQNPALEPTLRPQINAGLAQVAAGEQQLAQGQAQYQQLVGLETVLEKALTNTEATEVEVRSESLTGLLGMKLGENKNFQVYGGPVAQRLKAQVKLRGDAYSSATGYDLNVNPDTDYGWIAGLQYSKPEIALKASLTYRSEIDHDVQAAEVLPLAALRGTDPAQTNDMQITTPESVNFDFQTGINPTTLATAKVRWVPWSDFAITPPLYNNATKIVDPAGLNLVDYDDDQWYVELGLAKRVQPKLAVSGSLSWDSGAGDPTTSLGPIEGYYGVGAGAKYNLTDEWAVSAGGKYLWFGDAKGQIPTGAVVSNFENNDGFIVGVKLSYQN